MKMSRNFVVREKIAMANQGSEEAKQSLIEHYGYLFDEVMSKLKVRKNDYEDVYNSMVIALLETIRIYDDVANFNVYLKRNVLNEAIKCIDEISCTNNLGYCETGYDPTEEILDKLCSETLAKKMLGYLTVTQRAVISIKYGLGEEETVERTIIQTAEIYSQLFPERGAARSTVWSNYKCAIERLRRTFK